MPLYDYACVECNYQEEEIRPVCKRKAALACPKCGSELKLAWSPPADPVMNPARGVTPRRGGGGYA